MTPSQQIDKQITDFNDWRGELMSKLRLLVKETDPKVEEAWKWGVGIWMYDGMICAIAGFKDHVKMNFFKGASLVDPDKLLNAGFDSKKTRAIDFHEHDKLNEPALRRLIAAAIKLNTGN
jgi:hypothetical protein